MTTSDEVNENEISDEALIEKLKEFKFDSKSKKIICNLLPKTPETLEINYSNYFIINKNFKIFFIILVDSTEALKLDLINKKLEEKLLKLDEKLELIRSPYEKSFFNVVYAFCGEIKVITSNFLVAAV